MRYFDHDTAASKDDRLLALRVERGGAAVDCYWALLEKMYADEGPVTVSETNPETKSLTIWLAIGFQDLEKNVETMISLGLLKRDENAPEKVYSERAAENIENYQKKCKTLRQNAKKGGRKPKRKPSQKPDANQIESELPLRKEKKGIEIHKVSRIPDGARVAAADGAAPPAPAEGGAPPPGVMPNDAPPCAPCPPDVAASLAGLGVRVPTADKGLDPGDKAAFDAVDAMFGEAAR